jgi:hypothetical protein
VHFEFNKDYWYIIEYKVNSIFKNNDLILKGLNGTHELTIMPELFSSEPNVMKWKIDFNIFTASFYGGTGFGKSSIIIGLNKLPTSGTCSVNPLNGTSLSTIFTIECLNFTDSDGYIQKYQYLSK